MRRLKILTIAGAALLSTLCAEVRGEVTIRGVLRGDGGAGLAGAVVELRPWLGRFAEDLHLARGADPHGPLAEARSDGSGFFELTAPVGGSFLVEVTAPGRVPMASRLPHVFADVELPVVEPASASELEIQVRTAGGPVAGALVEVSYGPSVDPVWQPATLYARTSVDGRVTLPYHPGCMVRAFAAGYAPVGAPWPRSGDLTLELVSSPSSRTIVVRDGAGRVVAGALVRYLGLGVAWIGMENARPLGVSGVDGRFVFRPPPDGKYNGKYAIAVETEDGRYAWEAMTPESGKPRPFTVVLQEPRTVSGRVIDALTGQPLAGVRVWHALDPRRYDESDSDGRYEFSVPVLHPSFARFQAAAPGYLRATVPGLAGSLRTLAGRDVALQLAPEPSDRLEAVTRKSSSGFGIVADSEGRPVAEAKVSLSPPRSQRVGSRRSRIPTAITDLEGHFEIDGLASGKSDLRVAARGYAKKIVRGIEIDPESDTLVDFGTVVLERIPLVRADAEGRFVIPDLARDDEMTVEVRHRGFTTARIARVEVPLEEPVTVVLEPQGRVRGVVVDAFGEPPPKAFVSATYGDGVLGRRGASDRCGPDGRFELDVDAASDLIITATASGLRPTDVRLEVASGQTIDDLRLVLLPGWVVEGAVRGPAGDPIAGARIETLKLTRALWPRQHPPSDAAGRFRVEGLEPGPVLLQVSAEGFGRVDRPIDVRPENDSVEIRLATAHEVHGRVLDEESRPLGSAVVLAMGPERRTVAASGTDGTFVVKGLTAGSYRLSAGKPGFLTAELGREVEIVDGPVFGVEIRLSLTDPEDR